jgi:Tfp pilus assembly protein PilF
MQSRLFILLAIVIACAGCATTSGDPAERLGADQLEQIGQKYLAAGDSGQALKHLTLAEQKRPNDPSIQYHLGLAYNARFLHPQAILHMEKAVELKPNYSEASNALGAIYAEQGDFSKASFAFEKALSNPIYETPHIALYNLGRVQEKKGEPELALQKYEEALKLQPDYGLAHYRKGQILEFLKRGDEARRSYGRAVQYAPDLVDAHLRYGIMSYLAGELEVALYSLSKVVKLSPHSDEALEAKRYLQRLGALTTSQAETAPADFSQPHQLEVISKPEIQRPKGAGDQKRAKGASRVQPSSDANGMVLSQTTGLQGAVPIQETPSTAPLEQTVQTAALPPSGAEPGDDPLPPDDQAMQPAEPTLPPPPKYVYIVQIASFIDREKAGSMQEALRAKGYSAVVKQIRHQVLGPLHVVQLKPVNTMTKASTLLTQLEEQVRSEVESKLVILKVQVD